MKLKYGLSCKIKCFKLIDDHFSLYDETSPDFVFRQRSYSIITYTKDLLTRPGEKSTECFALPETARTAVKSAGAVKIKMSRKEIWLSSNEKSGVII